MTDFQAVILGFVQGFTEFLPISSNAHLKIVPVLLGWRDPGAAFVAVCQWGTVLATIIYFRKDILNILLNRPGESAAEGAESNTDQHLLVPIIIGTIPIVILGLLFKKHIEGTLRSMYVIAGS